MAYVDGFIVPVPEKNLDAYKALAEKAGKVWMACGALSYVEAVADDVSEGKTTDFYRAVKREEGETVFFSFITYKSREHRDEVNKKVMADPLFKDEDPANMPFSGKRLVWGGFKTVVAM